MPEKRLILASTSPRRRDILASSGLRFEVVPSHYEEDMTLDMEPAKLAMYLSQGKAIEVAKRYLDSVVIGADTFVVFEGQIYGKPHTKERAKETLNLLSGKTHSIITGFTVIDSASSKSVSQTEETKVTFRKLSNKEIDDYIATGEPLDRAGSYAIQGLGKSLIEKVDGDYNNIVGLPLNALLVALKDFGISIPSREDVLAKILWDYHHLNQQLEKADFIFVLGGHDLRVPQYGASLLLKGYGPLIGVSGGIAHQDDLLKTPWGSSEAEMFSKIFLEAGIPKEKILIEDKATNTGENYVLMEEVFERQGMNPKTVIVVQKPYMERRAFATGVKRWPDRKLIVTSPPISYEEYVSGDIPKEAIINIMVGDLQRIRLYGENGFQIPQEIPAEVWDAYEQLVQMGYSKHLSH